MRPPCGDLRKASADRLARRPIAASRPPPSGTWPAGPRVSAFPTTEHVAPPALERRSHHHRRGSKVSSCSPGDQVQIDQTPPLRTLVTTAEATIEEAAVSSAAFGPRHR